MNLDTLARVHAEEARSTVTSARIPTIGEITRRVTRRRWLVGLAGAALAGVAAVAVVVVGGLGSGTVPSTVAPGGGTIPAPVDDATFLEWSRQNGSVGREGILEVRLQAEQDSPELAGVRLILYPTLQSNGAYAFQVRIDGTGDICGFLEGTLEIDGNVGRFLNDVFPAPDELNIGASRPYYPYICKPDPQPGTIDAVLVAPFQVQLEPGALTISNSAGSVRFVASGSDGSAMAQVVPEDHGAVQLHAMGSVEEATAAAQDHGIDFICGTFPISGQRDATDTSACLVSDRGVVAVIAFDSAPDLTYVLSGPRIGEVTVPVDQTDVYGVEASPGQLTLSVKSGDTLIGTLGW